MREFGRYVLLERLKHGGMAEVHLGLVSAQDGRGRLVAVKILRPEICSDERAVAMFVDEAKLSVLLEHPHVVRTYEFGITQGRYFIVMEFVPGPDLESVLSRLAERDRQFPQTMAAMIVADVCEGLHYAHQKKDAVGGDLNIVHRDVSPQNVLLSYTGKTKLIDFGIAKAKSHVSETQVGALKGKYAYMSPEQVRSASVDHRSDIFSAGNLLYELLTGVRLFAGSGDYEVLDKVRTATFKPPGDVAPGLYPRLQDIVLRALEREPDARYQTAHEMAADLRSCIDEMESADFPTADLRSFVRELFRQECAHMTALAEKALRARFVDTSKEPEASPAMEPPPSRPLHKPTMFDTDDPTQPAAPVRTQVAMRAASRKSRGVALVVGALVMAASMVGGSLWFKHIRDTTARTGGLVVTTQPDGATLSLDGVAIGKSPFSAQGLRVGDHVLSAKLEGHREQQRKIRVDHEEVTIVELVLVEVTRPAD